MVNFWQMESFVMQMMIAQQVAVLINDAKQITTAQLFRLWMISKMNFTVIQVFSAPQNAVQLENEQIIMNAFNDMIFQQLWNYLQKWLLVLFQCCLLIYSHQEKTTFSSPPPKREEDIVNDDQIGLIYYDGDDSPRLHQIEDLQPIPIQQIENDQFEDKIEFRHYDEKIVHQSRDCSGTAPRFATNLQEMYNTETLIGFQNQDDLNYPTNQNMSTNNQMLRFKSKDQNQPLYYLYIIKKYQLTQIN